MHVVEIIAWSDFYTKEMPPRNPFPRPWMYNNSAASGSSMTGLKGLIAGGVIGGIEACLSYPTELAKTKLQLDEKSGAMKQYTGFFDVIKKTFKQHGLFGLYRGLGVILAFSIPKIGIRFSSFEVFKSYAMDEKGNLSPVMRVLCGLGAGVSEAVLAVTPMETVKVKFIHDQQQKVPQYKGLINGVMKIIKMDGLKGVYQGVVATVLKQGSNQAIRFYVMETLKQNYRGGDPTVPIPTPVIGAFGIAAATASVLGNTPIDVVKTRMQGLEAKKYKSTWDCAVKLWKKEGFLAFYKGTQARLMRVGIDVSCSFMMYEKMIAFFNYMWP